MLQRAAYSSAPADLMAEPLFSDIVGRASRLLGFANGPVYAYLVFVSFHAVFIHANVRFRFGPVEHWVVTPRFHHWHHSSEVDARDKNFAVHLPWIDRLLGTYYCPENRWPEHYGLGEEHIPDSYWSHVSWPFRRSK